MAFRVRPLWLLVVLAMLAWAPAIIRGGFSYDDVEIIESPQVRGDVSTAKLLVTDYWEHRGAAGHWRPVALLSLRMDHGLYGAWSHGYHLTNGLLHLAIVLLAWSLVRARSAPGSTAWPLFLGLAVFAIHPLQADSVAWISGRTGLCATLFGLLAARLLQRPGGRFFSTAGTAALGLALALGGKEDAVIWAPVLLISAPRERRMAVLLGVGLALVTVLALRQATYGSPLPTAPHAPLRGASLITRVGVGGLTLFETLRLLVLPVQFPPRFELADLQQAPGATVRAISGYIVFAWLLCAGLLLAWRDRGRPSLGRLAGLGLVLACLSFVPFLQWIPAGEVFAPRFAYLPLLFSSPFIGLLLARLGCTLPRPWRAVSGALLCGLLIAGTWITSRAYASRAAFQHAVLEHRPDDARAWNDLGVALSEAGDPAAATQAWERASQLDPELSRSWNNLGGLALQRGELLAARPLLERAVVAGPANPLAHCNLGNLYLRTRDFEAAAKAYARATQLAPGNLAAWRGLAHARLRLGQLDQARAAAGRARELDSGDPLLRALIERLDAAEH